MYCEKCHRQSPDNFERCAYCSAPFETKKKPESVKKNIKKFKKRRISKKTVIICVVAFAFVMALSAIITGVVTGVKPERVVSSLSVAIEQNDSKLYYSLYDEQMKEYKKSNWYFSDEETNKAMVEPLVKSINFYTEMCGEGFTINYEIEDVYYFSDSELESLCGVLAETYSYDVMPKKAARIDFVLYVKGEKGEYETVYKDFYCIKFGSEWYRLE
ncbi:MAG: hypothetical protein E7533_01975 [Ruminococcaceae bacterium]|nr:hypothetical protein [Oscillospiraceae bacterium]